MATTLKSFGFRHGLTINGVFVESVNRWSDRRETSQIIEGALVIDVRRWLPKNPYHNKKLRALRGDDDAVIHELEQTRGLELAYCRLRAEVDGHAGPVYLGCTGGHHRSVYVANRLAKDLRLPVEHLNYADK